VNSGVGQPKRAVRVFVSLTIVGTYFVALLLYATWFGIAMLTFIAPCYDKLSGPTFIEWFQKIDPYSVGNK
jgi:hypothetical protein